MSESKEYIYRFEDTPEGLGTVIYRRVGCSPNFEHHFVFFPDSWKDGKPIAHKSTESAIDEDDKFKFTDID